MKVGGGSKILKTLWTSFKYGALEYPLGNTCSNCNASWKIDKRYIFGG